MPWLAKALDGCWLLVGERLEIVDVVSFSLSVQYHRTDSGMVDVAPSLLEQGVSLLAGHAEYVVLQFAANLRVAADDGCQGLALYEPDQRRIEVGLIPEPVSIAQTFVLIR